MCQEGRERSRESERQTIRGRGGESKRRKSVREEEREKEIKKEGGE